MQLVSVSASLAIHSMSAKSACRLMAFLGLMVVVLFFVQMAVEGIGQGPLNSFQVSWIGLALLAPFSIFAKTFYATASLDLLLWGSLAVGINASLLTLCIRLDANFIEVAASASQRRYSRWQQVKRTGMIWSIEPVARWRLPQPRHLGGVGPIAWRQLTTALRTTSRPFAMCLAIAVVSGPALLTNTLGISLPTRLSLILCGTLLLLPKTLAFDFRGDVDQLNHLKSLPLRPIVIATGQLVTPVLLFTTIHLVMLASAMPFVDASQRRVFLAMALLTLPLNILLCGLDNLIFLLFPARMVPIGRLDFEFFGRMILDFSTKCVVLAACCVAGAVVGGIAYQMTNGSVIVRLMVTWLFLNFTAILAVFAVTWAFCRFDCDSPT
jgi:hypothetical protein